MVPGVLGGAERDLSVMGCETAASNRKGGSPAGPWQALASSLRSHSQKAWPGLDRSFAGQCSGNMGLQQGPLSPGFAGEGSCTSLTSAKPGPRV